MKLTPEQEEDLARLAKLDPDFAEALRRAIEEGILADSGKRQDGKIIWLRMPDKEELN